MMKDTSDKENHEYLNQKFDREYGPKDVTWFGDLKDGKNRGGHPYYCPLGWKKYALVVPHCESAKVCAQFLFKKKKKFFFFGFLGI